MPFSQGLCEFLASSQLKSQPPAPTASYPQHLSLVADLSLGIHSIGKNVGSSCWAPGDLLALESCAWGGGGGLGVSHPSSSRHKFSCASLPEVACAISEAICRLNPCGKAWFSQPREQLLSVKFLYNCFLFFLGVGLIFSYLDAAGREFGREFGRPAVRSRFGDRRWQF